MRIRILFISLLLLFALSFSFDYNLTKLFTLDTNNPKFLAYSNNKFYVADDGKAKIIVINKSGSIDAILINNLNIYDMKVKDDTLIFIPHPGEDKLRVVLPSRRDLSPPPESKNRYLTIYKFDFDKNYIIINGLNARIMVFNNEFIYINGTNGWRKDANEEDFAEANDLDLYNNKIYALEANKLKIWSIPLNFERICDVGGQFLTILNNTAYIANNNTLISLNLSNCNAITYNLTGNIKGLTNDGSSIFLLINKSIYRFTPQEVVKNESADNLLTNESNNESNASQSINQNNSNTNKTSNEIKSNKTDEVSNLNKTTQKENELKISHPIAIIILVILMLLIILSIWVIYYLIKSKD